VGTARRQSDGVDRRARGWPPIDQRSSACALNNAMPFRLQFPTNDALAFPPFPTNQP
jgi:hypothetical protein